MAENKKFWIAATTRYNQEISLRNQLVDKKVEHFIPTRFSLQKRKDEVCEIEKPIIPNLVFLKVSWPEAFELLACNRNKLSYIRLQDHMILTIPESQMDSFIRLTGEMKESLKICNDPYYRGDRVVIKSGPLAGIAGILVSVNGKREFILQVGNLLSVSVRIPKHNLIKIKDTSPCE